MKAARPRRAAGPRPCVAQRARPNVLSWQCLPCGRISGPGFGVPGRCPRAWRVAGTVCARGGRLTGLSWHMIGWLLGTLRRRGLGAGAQMQAIMVREPGGPEVLRVGETDIPQPGRGEVLVRVLAAGVGPWDAYLRSGGGGGPLAVPPRRRVRRPGRGPHR